MQENEIREFERSMPGVLDREAETKREKLWDDELILIGEDEMVIHRWLDDELYGEGTDPGDTAPWPLDDFPTPDQIRKALEDRPLDVRSVGPSEELRRAHDRLKRSGIGRHPGGLPDFDEHKPIAPPDVYAFYLPWHYYPRNVWGIYLIAEGIQLLAAQLHGAAAGMLSLAESRRIAQGFLFHHEAYHNAVETFAARVEIAHRKPWYLAGRASAYSDLGLREVHEESLATAYAIFKVVSSSFTSLKDRRLRQSKRAAAYWGLRRLVPYLPEPYVHATNLLHRRSYFEYARCDFQETVHRLSISPLPALPPSIWRAAQYSMAPSLKRNRKFTYVISRSHPAIRGRPNVAYFQVKRREFVRRLHKVVGGSAESGGKHMKWRTPDGRRAPIPGGTELSAWTCDEILKQLGVKMSIREFLGQ